MKHENELAQLAHGLPRVPKEKFDMNTWGSGHLKVDAETFDCHFAGCAMGWFPRLCPTQTLVEVERHGVVVGKVHNDGFRDIADYFDIECVEAHHLFDRDYYRSEYGNARVTPTMVAGRILEFLGNQR